MKQAAIVTRLADRHAAETRDFAESFEIVAFAGGLATTLRSLADQIDLQPDLEFPPGRYTIALSEPFE